MTALVVGLGGSAAQANSGATPCPTTRRAARCRPATPSRRPPAPAPAPAPAPTRSATAPSPTVRLLQQQLGQLNYYEGPVNGVWNPQVTQAITYLQRDARLPQTGHLDAATQSALNRMLATGNNQMAG